MSKLIADSGATKCEWSMVNGKKQNTFFTQGMSPYFLNAEQIENVIREELLSKTEKSDPEAVHFYGTGNKNPDNARRTKRVLEKVFPDAVVTVSHDLLGAARALCQHEPGI